MGKALRGMVDKKLNATFVAMLLRKKKIKFGPAVQKLRKAVAEHFLSKDLAQLEKMDFRQLNIFHTLDLSAFKVTLSGIYNEDCKSLGRKYRQLSENQFKNDFLRTVVHKQVHLASFFRVFTGGFEDRQEVIKIDPAALTAVRDETTLDEAFGAHLQKKEFFDYFKCQFINHALEKQTKEKTEFVNAI